ncbi:MAG TPA: DUF5808 domain-containing protein [Ignavibacteriales bacterium]|nr:DUF5808 domain-containing protein [Ignavibacteriales bacterium]
MLVWVWIVLAVSIIITVPVFYNTVITKKWRNKAEDEAKSWYLWGFYFNPKDSRMFLPKRSGLGITINFANPWAVAILIVLIVLIIAIGKVKHQG